MRVRSSSRFSRVVSDAWSAGDGIGETLGVATLDRTVPPRTAARQFRNIDGEIPTSVATCINGRPLLARSATASRLNSGENSRLVFVIQHLIALQAYQRCPPNRGTIIKSINDNHGHIVGDAVLREIASRIQFALPDAEIVARLGGDEFVVIVSDKTDDDLAISIEAVSSAICRWLSVGSLTIPVSASVGGAIWQPGVTIDGLMSFADARMYAGKSRRRRTA